MTDNYDFYHAEIDALKKHLQLLHSYITTVE